jgi:cysteine desulfurase
MKNKIIYLDYAAATPMDPRVREAMEPFFADNFYNPSAIYLAAKDAKKALEDARASIAKCLGVRPAEIYFTAGATEANNLAIQGIVRRFPEGEILVSAIEHESVLAPAELFAHKLIPAGPKGIVDLEKLPKLITDKTALISVMLINNELGTIQPIREIIEIIKSVRKERLAKNNKLPLYLHTDAAQAGNFIELKAARLGVDLMSINGGKIYGPKQSGVLYVNAKVQIKPLILGGGQERGLRSGTENVAGAVGLAKALEIAQAKRNGESMRLTKLRKLFAGAVAETSAEAVISGHLKHQAPHILHVTFPSKDNERLMMELDEAGVICAIGSACSASNDEPSHVLKAIGLSEQDARASLRFSLGRETTESDIQKTIEILKSLLS